MGFLAIYHCVLWLRPLLLLAMLRKHVDGQFASPRRAANYGPRVRFLGRILCLFRSTLGLALSLVIIGVVFGGIVRLFAFL